MFKTPSFWYTPSPTWRQRGQMLLLWPLSKLYGAIAKQKLKQPPRHKIDRPVICIGNITAGGAGKTPIVMALVKTLQHKGETPAVILRGVGRATKGARLVTDQDSAKTVGDEALLHHQIAPTAVGENRAHAAELVLKQHPETTVIVMDDGLQNTTLKQDIRINVINAAKGVGNGQIIPAGPLRAPLKTYLETIDVTLVSHTESEPARTLPPWPHPSVSVTRNVSQSSNSFKGLKVCAFTAIAHPDQFKAMLERTGANVIEMRAFADHKALSDKDAAALLSIAQRHSATLVTTQKDKARLINQTGAHATLFALVNTLDLEIVFDDEEAFFNGLMARLGALRTEATPPVQTKTHIDPQQTNI